MNKKFNEIIVWYHSLKDYQAGLLLLAKYGRNAALLRNLMKPGKEKFGGQKKLTYQLAKIAGFNPLSPPELPAELKNKIIVKKSNTALVSELALINTNTYVPVQDEEGLRQYPKIIRRIKYEYADKYKERSLLFKNMAAVPHANTLLNMEQRANYLKQIHEVNNRMDFLYEFVIAYDKRKSIPTEEIVWPVKKDKNKLPENIEDLRKMKKNLQSSNTKSKNILNYQTKQKQNKMKPVPPGPYRTELKLQISKREKTILAIQNLLAQMKYAH